MDTIKDAKACMQVVLADDSTDEVNIPTSINSSRQKMKAQGPWDQVLTEVLLQGPPASPMPVEIAELGELQPIYQHLKDNGDADPLPKEIEALDEGKLFINGGEEQNCKFNESAPNRTLLTGRDKTPYIEYLKGIVYADRRLDLCKMVVGPPHIGALLDSLESNTFIKHFLLGNNIIGPVGARRIARFIQDYPQRMDTWYLAGNCIPAEGLNVLVDSLIGSVATNIWLKRNPLTADAVEDIARLITQSKHLRTVDLDQTALTDAGVSMLFDTLASSTLKQHTLKNLYLNGNGIGVNAATSIARYLASPACNLESLFLANNPIGNAGIAPIAESLEKNTSIKCLMLASIGLTSDGASMLLQALAGHPSLVSLSIGQSYATEDLGARYNWIDDGAVPAIQEFILSNKTTRYFVLDWTSISYTGINDVMKSVSENDTFCWFVADTVKDKREKSAVLTKKLRRETQATLSSNIARLYNGATRQQFEAQFKRCLTGPEEDVRKTDSVYRNRDAGMARRGLKPLNKWWDNGDTTLQSVMTWS